MMRIARYLLTALLLAFIVFIYAQGTTPDVEIQDVEAAYVAAAEAQEQAASEKDAGEKTDAKSAKNEADEPKGLLDGLTLQKTRSVERFLGLDESLYEGILYWKSDYNMVADELVIAKAADANAVTQIQELLEQRVANQAGVFGDYAPEETAKVNSYTYKTRGNYVFFAIGHRAAEWERVFNGL